MKITLNWLRQYVAFDGTPEELAERLTMLGVEVEGMEKLGGAFDGIVVAEVITRDKHPNADKLSVCRVNDGQGERQIVCGASNFKAGDKVPLILPGASLPPKPGEEPFTIKVGRIRGVESHGMMCSPRELGISEDAAGLYILPPDAPVGRSFGAYLQQDEVDYLYDLEITPNRPDLNSVIGLSREISAVTGHSITIPDTGIAPGATAVAATAPGPALEAFAAVRIEDPDRCPRYTARLIRGVKVGPSPAWLKSSLEKVGIRSISNVVDVTNYVMIECGQPLHAFDYHLLARDTDGKPTIVVRTAAAGERFTTLDDEERELTPDMLLIADPEKGIALAGVMGGLNTEINDQTVDVLIESAYFEPTHVRRTAKALGLRTESSYRFERGADPDIADWASRRAAQLILQTAGGALVPGVIDACPKPFTPREVALRPARANALLGITLPANEQFSSLERLGLEILKRDRDTEATFRIPSFRVDLKRETDLIEEVCRLHGVDTIPSTPPRGATGTNAHDDLHDALAEVRRMVSALGLDEAQGQTLIGEAKALLAADAASIIRLSHPLSSDMDVLRPSLLPGLLDALQHNAHRNAQDVALFEVGRVFLRKGDGHTEARRLALTLTGARQAAFWGDKEAPRFDSHDIKGMVEEVLERMGVRGAQFRRTSEESGLWLETGLVTMGKQVIGQFGALHPVLARRCDLRHETLLAELDLDMVLARSNRARSFKPLPTYPSSRRDVAMFVEESVTHDEVLAAVRQAKASHLESVELFDIFRGDTVPAGQKSMAYAFTYRGTEQTLKDAEVNAEHAKVVKSFKDKLKATVRE